MPAVKIAGATMLIDEVDLPLISDRAAWLSVDGYPQVWKRQTVNLHRLIIGAEKGEYVDHINGDKLDNRRKNLRLCSNCQNGRNRIVLNKNNTSGYRGVIWNYGWMARIRVDGRLFFLGRFKTKEQAAKAYDEAALKYFGEFAGKLNFPQN